jgi:hypothetical protein
VSNSHFNSVNFVFVASVLLVQSVQIKTTRPFRRQSEPFSSPFLNPQTSDDLTAWHRNKNQ